jgi:protein-tyrosine phosphatase
MQRSRTMLPPLVDMHCHLLPGLDDGPGTDADAVAMCRKAHDEGTRLIAATAHQNERYPSVTPERIRHAWSHLAATLRKAGVALTTFPCAEVMVQPDMDVSWEKGDLLSVADRRKYLLIELPHGLFVDLNHMVRNLRRAGVRPILAHPERQEELLHDVGRIEGLIESGCLVQVSSGSVVRPDDPIDERALKSWFKRGIVHLLGSDGHSPTKRPPEMAEAYHRIRRWAGSAEADRIACINGMAVLQGLPLQIPEPRPKSRHWISRLW